MSKRSISWLEMHNTWTSWLFAALSASATACDVESDDPLDDLELRDEDDVAEPDCEIVPHMFHDWSLAPGVHGVAIRQVTFPECGEPIEFELTVTVGDTPVAQPYDTAEPSSAAPASANSYYLTYAGQTVSLGAGPRVWSTRFTMAPYQSWAVVVALVEIGANLDAQQIAGTWFTFAPPLAGGGQYRGPGDVVPGWVSGGTGNTRPPPNWQIPPGASRRTICSGRAPSICVAGVFWDAAASIAQTQGFCAAARAEHGAMASYAGGRNWPGYPAPSCLPTTGLTTDMWSSVRQRCNNAPARVACDRFSPLLSPFELLDLTTDVLSTNNLWEGCRRELDAMLGC